MTNDEDMEDDFIDNHNNPTETNMTDGKMDNGSDGTTCSDGKLHLVVPSKVLSLSSPVFKTTLTGCFKEGVELAQKKALGYREPYVVICPMMLMQL